MSKEWKSIPGYKGYEASSDGEIRNCETGHITKGGISGPYRRVSVYKTDANEPELAYVHDLVCCAFHGKGKEGQVVLHKDDNKVNCRPSNLKWGTQSENIQSAYDKGLISKESEQLPQSILW